MRPEEGRRCWGPCPAGSSSGGVRGRGFPSHSSSGGGTPKYATLRTPFKAASAEAADALFPSSPPHRRLVLPCCPEWGARRFYGHPRPAKKKGKALRGLDGA